jgi:hypothetical protein
VWRAGTSTRPTARAARTASTKVSRRSGRRWVLSGRTCSVQQHFEQEKLPILPRQARDKANVSCFLPKVSLEPAPILIRMMLLGAGITHLMTATPAAWAPWRTARCTCTTRCRSSSSRTPSRLFRCGNVFCAPITLMLKTEHLPRQAREKRIMIS